MRHARLRQFALCMALAILVWPMTGAATATAVATEGVYRPVERAQARVLSYREVTLAAPVAVEVTSVAVEVGEVVTADTLLGRLTVPALATRRAELAARRHALALARKAATSVTESVQEGAATRADALAAEATVANARAAVVRAEGRVEAVLTAFGGGRRGAQSMATTGGSMEVRAPFAGMVTARPATTARLPADAPLFHLAALEPIDLEVALPPTQIAAWRTGAVVCLTPAGNHTARLLASTPRVDPATGLALLRLRTRNADHALLPGSWCTVRVTGPPVRAVWVPGQAVVEREGRTYCMVRHDGDIRPVVVTVAGVEGGRAALVSGVQAGDTVVTEGAYELLYRDLDQLMKFVD